MTLADANPQVNIMYILCLVVLICLSHREWCSGTIRIHGLVGENMSLLVGLWDPSPNCSENSSFLDAFKSSAVESSSTLLVSCLHVCSHAYYLDDNQVNFWKYKPAQIKLCPYKCCCLKYWVTKRADNRGLQKIFSVGIYIAGNKHS